MRPCSFQCVAKVLLHCAEIYSIRKLIQVRIHIPNYNEIAKISSQNPENICCGFTGKLMLLYDFWTIIIIWNVYSNFTDELPYVELNIQFKLIDLPFFHVNSFLNFSRDLPHVYNFPPIINRAYEYVVLMICKIRIFKHLKPISAKYLGVIVRTPAQFKAFNLLPTALFNIQFCIVRTPKIAQSFSN